jgi:Holliday junction resolvasome RuvABC DNA-binding subunit
MKFTAEVNAIWKKIQQTSTLNDEALTLLGYSKEKIDKAMKQCCDAGMSRKKAMHAIVKMYKFAEPVEQTELNDSGQSHGDNETE